MILLFLLHALFALTFPLTKIAIQNSEPLFFTAIRMFTGGIIILSYQYFNNKRNFKNIISHSSSYFYYIFLLAVFNVFLANATECWALKYLNSANACFIYSITPFISALLSYFLFNEYISKKKLLGMIIGTIGFIFMLLTESNVNVECLLLISWPDLYMLIAAIATSYGWIAMRQLINKLKSDNQTQEFSDFMLVFANSTSMIIGGLISFSLSLLFEDKSNLFNFNQEFIISFLGMILVSNIIGYNLYAYLLKKYSATLMSFVGFIEPAFTAFYGYILLGETVTFNFWLACLIVILGLYIFYVDDLKEN